jgi:hypothetical protein
MDEEKRHIVFIDLLGLRRNLLHGQAEYAREKVIALASIVENMHKDYPDVRIHGSSDFFILYGIRPDMGWVTAQAAMRIFENFYDLNDQKNIRNISAAYLLRGGLAYGEVEEISKSTDRMNYSFALGDGLGFAYETLYLGRGMRLFIQQGASRHFIPVVKQIKNGIQGIQIDKCYATDGRILSSEIRWVGAYGEAERRLERARILFRKALAAFRRREITEDILENYQQTLCAILRGCSSPRSLLPFLDFRHQQTRHHKFLSPVWTTAWLRLLRPKNTDYLPEIREILWRKFLTVSGTSAMGEVATTLHQRNRWRPLLRFLKKGKVRFGARKR